MREFRRFNARHFAASTLAIAIAGGSGNAHAQEAEPEREAIVVTGSYIAKAVQDSASPISLVGADELAARGIQSVEHVISAIPANGLSRRFSDAIGAGQTVGTSQINLRGLGVSSTLTLINGRRQTLSPTPDADGASFVDINPIPLGMIERVEALTDGASAIYGSDAVAGVVNFIMRRKMEGVKIRGSYASTLESNQADASGGIVGGFSSGSLDVVAGVDYLHRTRLILTDRAFAAGNAFTGLGFPGAFQPVGGGARVRDPNCAALGGIPFPGNLCGRSFAGNFDLVPAEDRVTSYATATYALNDQLDLYAELGLSHSKVDATGSPSYPNTKFPIVPANNPGNLVANGGLGVPAYLWGRYDGGDVPSHQTRSIWTYRGVVGLQGEISDSWRIDTALTFSRQTNYAVVPGDYNEARFEAALNCQGGPNNNLCYNPFGSSRLNPALANSPEVIADFARDRTRAAKTSLLVGDAVLSGQVAELPGGPLSIAVGGQFRHETLAIESGAESAAGELAFFYDGPNFSAGREIYALFTEIDMPLRDWITLNLAGRYENLGEFGDTFNPKASLRIEAADGLVLRGSVGSSFRAPSMSQITGVTTGQGAVSDPLNPAEVPYFIPIVTTPNSDLRPETSLGFNLGMVWKPMSNLSISLDYYNIDYSNLISRQDATAIINADPNDPRVIRLGPGQVVQQVNVSFVNLQSVKTDGLDFALDYSPNVAGGKLQLTGRASYVLNYKADVGHGGVEQLAGYRNYQNFAPPTPHLRGNVNARFSTGPHELSVTVTYIGPVRENFNVVTNPDNGFKIGSFTTVDAQYSFELKALDAQLTVGVQNIFGVEPPPVKLTNNELTGFDRQLHDPRGTIAHVGFSKSF